MAYNLTIGGVSMPEPKQGGLTVEENKVWSKNTGRSNNTAKMLGTIVAIKRKLEIEFPPLTPAQLATVKSAISTTTPFKTVVFDHPAGGTVTMTAYFGDFVIPVYSWNSGCKVMTGVKISCIEQ